MCKVFSNIYLFFITFPDRLYPFAYEINGRRVRGRKAYEKAVAHALRKYGVGRLGYKLTLYREVFHFLGSIFFIAASSILAKYFFGSDIALYILLYGAILALTYQEFYLHPKRYGQHFKKGALDWFFWVGPMLVFLFH